MTDDREMNNARVLIKQHQVLVVHKGQKLTKELEDQIDMYVEGIFTPNGCLFVMYEVEI